VVRVCQWAEDVEVDELGKARFCACGEGRGDNISRAYGDTHNEGSLGTEVSRVLWLHSLSSRLVHTYIEIKEADALIAMHIFKIRLASKRILPHPSQTRSSCWHSKPVRLG